MRIRGVPADLTYCLNVHPGETWADHAAAIRTLAASVRDAVAPGRPFALGLRIGARAAADLLRGGRLAAFAAELRALGMYAATINGFPHGRFHGPGVKEKVYAPDWRTAERLRYTLRLAEILAALLPRGGAGGISTVPGSFRAWIRGAADARALAVNLGRAAAALDALRRRTGRTIHLGLEPEPDCWIETMAEFAARFDDTLLPRGAAAVAADLGVSLRRAETVMRRHLGVCADTCHLSVLGERPADALRLARRAGFLVSKIQLSAAPVAPNTPAGRDALAAFAEPVYLHQTRAGGADGAAARWTDLPAALAALPGRPDLDEIRTHCHVPLFWRGGRVLRSTAAELDADFWRLAGGGLTGTLEIETYTFGVLPAALRRGGVVRSIVREYAWVLGRLGRR